MRWNRRGLSRGELAVTALYGALIVGGFVLELTVKPTLVGIVVMGVGICGNLVAVLRQNRRRQRKPQ